MPPLRIPGYDEAVAAERFLRDSAFMSLSETVAGFELRQVSLRDFIVLRIIGSPLISGDTPSPEQLAQFLWIQSVDHGRGEAARRRFMKRCRYLFIPPPQPRIHFPWSLAHWKTRCDNRVVRGAEVLAAARAYMDDATMDAPPTQAAATLNPEYHSSVCFWVALFNYQYTPDQVLAMPLKLLFQFLQQRRSETRGTAPLFNRRSDRVKNDYLVQRNRELKAQAAAKKDPTP